MTAFGNPPPSYIAANDLPPVGSMRPNRVTARPKRQGGSGTTITGGLLRSLDTNNETTGAKWYGSLGRDGISGKMRRDPHVKESIGYVTNPLQAARWRWKPASKSELDREVADFLDYCFFELLPWSLVIEQLVGGYVADGFALGEMTDKVSPFPVGRFPLHPNAERGSALVPTGIHKVPANTIGYWHKDEKEPGRLAAVDQWQPYTDNEDSGYRRIEGDRLIRITTGQEGSNFAGVPILRSAYGSWKLKNAFEIFEAIGFERTAIGTPVAIAGEETDPEEMDAVELILENMRAMSKGAAVLPNGYTFSWEGAGESDVQNLNIAIERCNTDFAINVSAGFTRLGLTGPGSYALGTTQVGQYHLSTVKHAALLSIALSLGLDGWSPARRLVEQNYGIGTPVPVLQARNLPTRDVKTILPLIYNGISTNAITPDDSLESEIREMVDVGPHDPTTARVRGSFSEPTPAAREPATDPEQANDE